jgi:hypothetical protein
MRARLLVMLAGDPMREIGEITTGDEATRLVAAGLAVAVVEEVEETVEPEPKPTPKRRAK